MAMKLRGPLHIFKKNFVLKWDIRVLTKHTRSKHAGLQAAKKRPNKLNWNVTCFKAKLVQVCVDSGKRFSYVKYI